jgi:shikimate dehydrogenase
LKRLYGIIGFPVSHSLSPVFQQAAFDTLGLDAAYVPFEIPPERLDEALDAMSLFGVQGFNVTLPHKEAVYRWVSSRDPVAERAKAVNTVIRKGSSWLGANTDVPGFRNVFQRFLERTGKGTPYHPLVFGAGGSARSVVLALLEAGVPRLTVANRSIDRAELLVSDLQAIRPESVLNVSGLSALEDDATKFDYVINTLSRDAFGEDFPPLSNIDVRHVRGMMDLSYRPDGGATPFLGCGIARSVPVEDGLPMLLEQGAISFKLWTSRDAPRKAMSSAIEKKLGRPVLWE